MPCFGPLLTKVRRTVSARHIKRAKMQWQNKKTKKQCWKNKRINNGRKTVTGMQQQNQNQNNKNKSKNTTALRPSQRKCFVLFQYVI